MSEKELDTNEKDIPGKTVDYETNKIPSVETEYISDEVPESLDKTELLSDENFALSEKIIRMSQEAINRAEKTLSAPGSYNKPHKISLEVPQQTCPILGSSASKYDLFQKRNKVEPLNFQKCSTSPLPFVRKNVLKLRLPLENCTTETRIMGTNRKEDICKNEKEFPESQETCTCIARSKRTRKLCTVQVQYIFQDPKGRIICKSCSTPESIRIPQKITCSAQNCLTCYQCSKVLSPPCECSACSKNNYSA